MVFQSWRQLKAFEHCSDVYRLGSTRASAEEKKPARPNRLHEPKPFDQNDVPEVISTQPEEEGRVEEKVEQRSGTSGASSTIEGQEQHSRHPPATAKEVEEERPHVQITTSEEENDPFLVEWSAEEPSNPKNWSWTRKWTLVAMVTSIALLVGVAASIDSAAAEEGAIKFGVGLEVIELQTAVFLIGFGIAAPILGPLSEIGGRNPVYVITLLAFILFTIGSASAPNIQTRVILRFFAGFFGSTPLSNAGGSIADIVDSRERTFVFPIFANAGFLGPVLGPAMGGYLGWKVGEEWNEWLVAIWGAATLFILVAFMPETYAPTLLKMKASQIRRASGDSRYKSALEKQREKMPFRQAFRHSLALPFLYLIYEPIILFVSLYLTMVYIILFGYFEAYSLLYQPFGLNPGEIGLTFISVAIGLFLSTFVTPTIYKRYLRLLHRAQDQALERGKKDWMRRTPEPEERLIIAMVGTWLIPVSLFYQGWTCFPGKISVWVPISAGVLFGAGILTCFIASYQYIIDVYQTGSASALASLTFVRYIASGGAVMFTRPMYLSLGNHWALSLLGFLSIVFSLIPWVFYIFGKRIRTWSRYTPPVDD